MEHAASCRSLVELHRVQSERLGPRPALRARRHGLFRDLTWNQYRSDALACAAALVEAGLQPGDRVGLLAENRLEWLIADMGIMTAAGVTVPLHSPLSPRQVEYQLADAGASWLFVSSLAQLQKVEQILGRLSDLRGIIMFDGPAGKVSSLAGFLLRGHQAYPRFAEELTRREAALGLQDLATVMYTSGTTGNPKGVMLTHGNLLSNASASIGLSDCHPLDRTVSWLPFSHIYARTVDIYAHLVAGYTMCLADSADTLVKDIADVQPMRMTGVPRFYEKVLQTVAAANPEETGRRLRAVFGPHLDWLSCGGAPLPPKVAETYKAAGVLLLQGYGLTESSPVITFNRKAKYKLETVGQPLPGVEVKINPDGEILTRGPHVMKGYWNKPEATAATIRDGWLHTGDLGKIDDEGFLTITGRKKDLLVLSNGKKVAPNLIENLLSVDPCIEQVVVYGEGHHYLTALMVPNWERLRRVQQLQDATLGQEPVEILAQHPTVYALLQQRVDTALAELSPWERIRKLVILPHPFTVANEELTVSLKLRRDVVFHKHRHALEELYRD